MNDIMNICLSSDNNYAPHLATVIISVLKNSPRKSNFRFHIFDGGISDNNKNKILELRNIKNFQLNYYIPDIKKYNEWFDKLPQKTRFSPAMLYRLSIPSLLSNIDKVLYLDSDLIVTSNIQELFEIDVENYYALVRVEHFKNKGNYFNSGVMMINNKLWIRDNLLEKFEDYFINNYEKCMLGDQDILNPVLNNNIKDIGNQYNYYIADRNELKDLNYIKILHYASKFKPWLETTTNKNTIYLYEYWKYFSLSPWFKEEPLKYIRIMIKQEINENKLSNDKISALEKENKLSNDKISVLEKENKLSNDKISVLEKENKLSNDKISILEKYIDKINNEKDNINKKLNNVTNNFKRDIDILNRKINLFDFIFSIYWNYDYLVVIILFIRITFKRESFIKKASWWIPIKKWRDNFRDKFAITRPDQTRPDQTRPDQTRPDLIIPYVSIIYVFIIIQNTKKYNLCCNTKLQHRFFVF